jgi:hypothetical protein
MTAHDASYDISSIAHRRVQQIAPNHKRLNEFNATGVAR